MHMHANTLYFSTVTRNLLSEICICPLNIHTTAQDQHSMPVQQEKAFLPQKDGHISRGVFLANNNTPPITLADRKVSLFAIKSKLHGWVGDQCPGEVAGGAIVAKVD